MQVSIVLPNMNGAGWLKGSIDSLYAQTMTDFELIVVDNASSDESLDIARSYTGTTGYTLIENKENTGFSAAVNAGIRLAKAPFVLLFNNDAFAAPDMLERLLQCIGQEEKIFSVQCLMLRHHDPSRIDNAGDFVNLLGWAFQRGNSLPVTGREKPQRIFSACGGAALYRKSVLETIGLFDEHFFAYLEDVDIGWRANSLGYKNVFCPTATCTHIAGATTGGAQGATYNPFKSIQSGRNNLLLPYKNLPLLMFILNLPFLLLGYLTKTLVFHLRGYGKYWRQGFGEALRVLGQLEKPPFKLKNLPCCFWIEGSLMVSTVRFIVWRVRRMLMK